jgi:hypothetical protein
MTTETIAIIAFSLSLIVNLAILLILVLPKHDVDNYTILPSNF